MIKSEEKLKLLANSDHALTLMVWLDEQTKQLSDITKIKDYDELLGKQEAVKILKELFGFLERARQKQPDIQKTDYK